MLATSGWCAAIWDGDVMGWHGTDLAEDDARQQGAGFNVTFNALTLDIHRLTSRRLRGDG
jgi:hypothetical protein